MPATMTTLGSRSTSTKSKLSRSRSNSTPAWYKPDSILANDRTPPSGSQETSPSMGASDGDGSLPSRRLWVAHNSRSIAQAIPSSRLPTNAAEMFRFFFGVAGTFGTGAVAMVRATILLAPVASTGASAATATPSCWATLLASEAASRAEESVA
jgi:hypothetical protein